jgi:hypothetical protein
MKPSPVTPPRKEIYRLMKLIPKVDLKQIEIFIPETYTLFLGRYVRLILNGRVIHPVLPQLEMECSAV